MYAANPGIEYKGQDTEIKDPRIAITIPKKLEPR